MKNSLLKKSRADLLFLLLESSDENTDFEKCQQKFFDIQTEQIRMGGMIVQKRQTKTSKKISLKQRDKRNDIQERQRFSTVKVIHPKPTLQKTFRDENEIIKQCKSLSLRVQILKKKKLEYAIKEFENEERKKMNSIFQKKKKAIHQKYQKKKKILKVSYGKEALRLAQSFEELDKLKTLYGTIFEDLNERRKQINQQFQFALLKIKRAKDKLLEEWKNDDHQQVQKIIKHL